MKKIISKPEARDLLRQYAKEWDKPELNDLADALSNRTPVFPRAKAQRKSLNPQLAAKIALYKNANPTESNFDIGAKFGVNGARVSEAIHGIKAGRA